MAHRGDVRDHAAKVVVFIAISALVVTCILPASSRAEYISSSIWITGNTVYARSETYLNTPGQYTPANLASVSCLMLVYPAQTSYNDAICNPDSASVTISCDRADGYYYVTGDHYASSTDNNCYSSCCGGHWLGYTHVDLTIADPAINYFYANPTHLTSPGTATLYYGTQNATSVTINGISVPPGSGTFTVNPNVTTAYTLTITNGDLTKQATVVVFLPTPLNPLYYQNSFRREKGASPFFPIMPIQGDSINSANGNLFFKIPLLSRPGRNGMGVDLALAYNSKIWDFFVQSSTLYATIAEPDAWLGPGWSLLVGRILDDSANGHYYVTLSDGSNHDLTYYGGAWRSRDSSYMTYNPATYKLTLKGGLNLTFNHVDQFLSYARYATRVQDTNGNYLEISYASFGGRINTIQDTLGNTYTFLLNSSGCLQYIKYWNTNDVSQATSTITFNYQNQSLDFGSGATTDPLVMPQMMLKEVIYPSGLRYSLAYTSGGEISEITQPLCAKSHYYYGSRNIYDRLLARTVPDHPISSRVTDYPVSTWTWNYYANSGIPSYTTILFPNGTTVTHYMQKSSPGWADGFLTKATESGSPGTGEPNGLDSGRYPVDRHYESARHLSGKSAAGRNLPGHPDRVQLCGLGRL